MSKRILILGGTKEAAKLASELVNEGHDVTTSLAGRTKEPKPIAGRLRIGGFGGAEGLTTWLRDNQIDKLIDATHPFAKQISLNAKDAAEFTSIPLEVRIRPPWTKRPEDIWIEVKSLEAARDAIPEDAHVLLALGSQHINLFASRADVFFIVRMVDPPETPLVLPKHELLIGTPSANWKDEAQVMQANQLTQIVCRNSGGTGAYAKIEAARRLQLPVIMVQR